MVMKEKTTSALTQDLQKCFNEWVRLRDKGLPCISCGAPNPTDAGHLFKKSIRPAMRFIPEAAHAQCRACNSLPDGNYEAFCQGIAKRYGAAYLERVIQMSNESRKVDFKPTRTELREMIAYYKNEIKKLHN